MKVYRNRIVKVDTGIETRISQTQNNINNTVVSSSSIYEGKLVYSGSQPSGSPYNKGEWVQFYTPYVVRDIGEITTPDSAIVTSSEHWREANAGTIKLDSDATNTSKQTYFIAPYDGIICFDLNASKSEGTAKTWEIFKVDITGVKSKEVIAFAEFGESDTTCRAFLKARVKAGDTISGTQCAMNLITFTNASYGQIKNWYFVKDDGHDIRANIWQCVGVK